MRMLLFRMRYYYFVFLFPRFCIYLKYHLGDGVTRDEALSNEYLWLAANQNFAVALQTISDRYSNGIIQEQDSEKAALYHQLAIENGYDPNKATVGLENILGSQKSKAITYDWDIPAVNNYIKVGVVLGQNRIREADSYTSKHRYYTYDYYGSDTTAAWAEAYIDAITKCGPFELVDYQSTDSNGSLYDVYFFRYTGSKKLSRFQTYNTDKFKVTCNLEVEISHYHRENRVCIAVRMPMELVYEGKDQKEGTWFSGYGPTPNPSIGPDPIPTITPTPYRPKQPCPICHTSGEVECRACDGNGGKWIYDNSTKNKGSTWDRCTKCGGDGRVPCTYCGGDGYIND